MDNLVAHKDEEKILDKPIENVDKQEICFYCQKCKYLDYRHKKEECIRYQSVKAKDPILDGKTHHQGSDTDSKDKWENVTPDKITVNDNTMDEDDRNVMELEGAEMNESGE